MREIADILLPSLPIPAKDHTKIDSYMLRLFASVLISRRKLLFEATAGQDRGTRRCFAHIARLAPDMPPSVLQHRLMLMLLYGLSASASMEAAIEDHEAWKNLWSTRSARSNLADTMAGIILAPVSAETLHLLEGPQDAES